MTQTTSEFAQAILERVKLLDEDIQEAEAGVRAALGQFAVTKTRLDSVLDSIENAAYLDR